METSEKNNGGIEKRSKRFYQVGFAFSYWIVGIFFVTFLTVFVATESWRLWAFRGTLSLEHACTYSLSPEAGDSFRSIDLPKKIDREKVQTTAENVALMFRCRIPDISSRSMAYAHWGWVGGEDVTIRRNQQLVVHFSGTEKVAFPVASGDSIEILIEQSLETISRAGFIGFQPPVVAASGSTNNFLFGLEVFVSLTRSLSHLFPIMSLGAVLGFAWFSGFRSRNLFISLYILIWAILYRACFFLSFFSSFDPLFWESASHILRVAFSISFVLFHQEVLRVKPKWIYPIARWSSLAAACLVVAKATFFPITSDAFNYSLKEAFAVPVATALFAIGCIAYPRRHENRIATTAVFLGALVYFTDSGLRYFGISLNLVNYLQIITPAYVSVLLLSSMSSSDKKYTVQRRKNAALSQQMELEAAKTATLARFLPQTLVGQFTTKESIEIALERVLSPHTEKIAIIQADLRGFSELVRTRSEVEVIRILHRCFGPVVDEVQKFAMVKLIGDCLFAFVEKPVGDKSTVDLALEIAARLIHQTAQVNLHELSEPNALRFGIAINYGPCIIGNLSSDHCIDYTAIGGPVNFTARLEELTKNEAIAREIGPNGVVLSEESCKELRYYSSRACVPLLLGDQKVRSFAHVERIYYLREVDCLSLVKLEWDRTGDAA